MLIQTIEENKQLRERVSQLESKATCSNCDKSVDAAFDQIDPDVPDETLISDKQHVSVLILSDSIFRHVGTSVPKTPGPQAPIYKQFDAGIDCMNVCIPGAQAPRLFSEAVLLRQKYTFDEIIVHCGANYVPNPRRHSRFDAAVPELTGLLSAIRQLFDANITYSATLPQRFAPPGCINFLNCQLDRFCADNGFSWFYPTVFNHSADKLVARDGIHLNFAGVDELTAALVTHVKFTFIYEY